MKITINLEVDKDTNHLEVKNKLTEKLIEWNKDNFWKGNLAEINIEETK